VFAGLSDALEEPSAGGVAGDGFGGGASSVEELVLRARELGYEALALTDHDGLCDDGGTDDNNDALPDTWEDTYACTDKWTAAANDDNGTDGNGDTIADCLDPDADTDSDTTANPDDPTDDAWPPDMNRDTDVNVLDVLLYKPKLTGVYDRRYDLTAEGSVDILDLLLYKPFVNTSCTNP